jgi:hypothetical protein
MAEVTTGTKALRLLNHHTTRRRDAGASEEELAELAEVKDWIRGMLALDLMAREAEAQP